METFIVKTEPKFENIEEHEYHIQVIGYEEEAQSKLNTESSSSNVAGKQAVPKKSRATKKVKTENKVVKVRTAKFKKNHVLPFTIYIQKKFLSNFLEYDCTSQCIDQCLSEYNVKREELKEYFGKHINDAKDYVYQECDSLCFNNITEWLKYFEQSGVHRNDNYESAVIMNAIVNNEPQPNPQAMGGVDLKSVYKFISNALLGLPQKQLDPKSAKFLSNEFESLINEANTDEADDDVRTMKTRLESSSADKREQPFSTLDPLKLTDTGELYRICQNSHIEENSHIVKKEK